MKTNFGMGDGRQDPSDRASNLDAREQVVDEQLRMVWTHSHIGIVVASMFAVVLAFYMAGFVDGHIVRAWVVVKLLIAGARLIQARAFMGQPDAVGAAWQRGTLASLAIDGVVWGAAGYWLMAQSIPVASLAAASLACISCVATFGLQVSKRATAAYVIPILVPTIGGMVARSDDFGWFGGAGLLMLMALQLTTASRSERRLTDGVLLRLRAQALAKEKDQALALALHQSAIKSQFLANISHELRTPMHGILGLARVMHMEISDAALLRRVELIEGSGRHLMSLINDLLDISRIEAGHLSMQREVFDIGEQVDQVAGVHAVRAEDKGLRFIQQLDMPRPCWVLGDPARFRQVLHNLLGNAIKFTLRGEVALVVARSQGDPSMVVVGVRDTGPGIPPGELAQIFEAFRQSGTSPAMPLEGAGLGLTIAREIARAMGGDVVVSSHLGEGSTLTFTAQLPATAAPPAAPLLRPTPILLAPLGMRVLVAEDDDINALIASAYLERLAVGVERVADGRRAVEAAMRIDSRPDLILMDCRMPVMDGYAATREIRAQEAALGMAPVPVVALTATVTDADRQLCADAGMSDFVTKPFTMDELAAVLNQWLPRPLRASAEDARAPPSATDADRDETCRS